MSGLSNKKISEQAAKWAVLIDDQSLNFEQKRDLLAWLKASPTHMDEFLLAISVMGGLGVAARGRKDDIDEILSHVSAEIVSLDPSDVTSAGDPPPASRFRPAPWFGISLAACLAIMALIMSQTVLNFTLKIAGGQSDSIVATVTGEQRSVTLEDGSIVFINTESEIEIQYTENYRTIEIKRGEALFEVEKDLARPFRVIAGNTVTQALGTRFNVRYINNETEVSVLEGTVAFEQSHIRSRHTSRSTNQYTDPAINTPVSRVILKAGEGVDLSTPSTAPIIKAADEEVVSAWTARKLVFRNRTLADISEEFNRYNRAQLVFVGDELGEEVVSGVFAADDPDSLVDFIRLTRHVTVTQNKDQIRVQPRSH